MRKTYITGVKLLLITLIFVACSDNPTGGLNSDEIPPVPNFQDLRMDLSVFKGDPSNSASDLNFNSHTQASFIAIGIEAALNAMAMWPNVFFNEEAWGEPRLENGIYTWDYSYAYEGESISFTITANELQNNTIDWQMRFSLQTSDISIDDALFLRAVVSSDGREGSWEIYDLENEGEEVAQLDFLKNEDGNPVYISVTITEGEFESSQIVYEVDGETSSLILLEGAQTDTEIVWNNQTGSGFIITDGEKSCWDENYEDTPCS